MYVNVHNLSQLRAAPGQGEATADQYVYDADHERRRKEQLEKLFERTREQVEEEERLLQELKKIETRKKERERKAQVPSISSISCRSCFINLTIWRNLGTEFQSLISFVHL